MPTIGEMKDQMDRALKQVRALCDLATEANRDFTAAERVKLDAYQKEAAYLKVSIEQAEGDADLRNQILGLSALVAGGAGNRPAPGPWAKAFHAATMGRKDLVPSGAVLVPNITGLIGEVQGPMTSMLQVIPTTGADGDGVTFLRETSRVHAAATVKDSEKKPESSYVLEQVSDRLRTVAHLSPPTPNRFFDDVPTLSRYLDVTMRQGLEQELERLCVSGDGVTGDDFAGMLGTAGIQVQPFTDDVLGTCRRAITLLEEIYRTPSAWVLNPQDWQNIELTKDGELRYYLSNVSQQLPIDRAKRALWSVPVALSMGVPQGTGLLFHAGSLMLYERGPASLSWSEAFPVYDQSQNATGASGFQSNLRQWRAEGRYLLAVLSPLGVVQVDLEGGS